MTLRPVAAACVALAVSLASPGARSEAPTIYKWIDENGVAHYTTDRDRIPSEIRTRIERPSGAVAAPIHPEDEMRDAVRVKPRATVAAPLAPAPATEPAEAAEPPETAAIEPAPADAVEPEPLVEPAEVIAAPLANDAPFASDPVSAPPPAPVAPLAPEQEAQVADIDGQISSLEGEIALREEKLAALISSPDEERTTALVDDPGFREISQRLPKLQSELQTLRERRDKIQPPANP